jgi:hypothetical protein
MIGKKFRCIKENFYFYNSEWEVISKTSFDNEYLCKCIKGDFKFATWTLPAHNFFQEITDLQIGGTHYTQLEIQPDEYAHKNGLNFMQGNAIKYITRYKFKNGRQDLEKAISVLQKLIQFEYPDNSNKSEKEPINGKKPEYRLLSEEAYVTKRDYQEFKKQLDCIFEKHNVFIGSPGSPYPNTEYHADENTELLNNIKYKTK